MLKKLFAVLIAILVLCSCGVQEKPEIPEAESPEIPEIETPVVPEPEKTEEPITEEKEIYPQGFELINEDDIMYIYVSDSKENSAEFYPLTDSFIEIIEKLRGFEVSGSPETFSNESFQAPNEEHVYMIINFNSEKVYNLIFTNDSLKMIGHDFENGLDYKTEESGYDLFIDYTLLGGGANPMTGKPVIYLYPEKETKVTVNLDFDGKITYTYPAINNGWKVLAKPDGTLTNLADNSTHYYLFWEGTARPEWTYEKGFVVKGSETEKFLRENLAKMGLTPREYNDFITYWVPKMQENQYNLISFSGDEYSEIAKLTVDPKPDSVIRIHMMWKALDEPIEIKPQVLTTFERKGFTLVEWGGTELF